MAPFINMPSLRQRVPFRPRQPHLLSLAFVANCAGQPLLRAMLTALVDSTERPFNRHQQDQPFDLPPSAEMDMITHIPAPVGARCSLANGIYTKKRDQFRCVLETFAIPQKWNVHISPPIIARRFDMRLFIVPITVPEMPESRAAGVTKVNNGLGKFHIGTDRPLAGQRMSRYGAHIALRDP